MWQTEDLAELTLSRLRIGLLESKWLSSSLQTSTHVTARRIAQPPIGDLCHEAPTHPVARTSRSSATGSIDNSPGGFLLH